MTVEERNKRIIELLNRRSEELIAKGPEACREYLISLGIYNEDGSLHENYGGEAVDPLLARCRAFIEENRISCRDTVYQSDRVIQNGYDFIADICDIVGYHRLPDDEDDE